MSNFLEVINKWLFFNKSTFAATKIRVKHLQKNLHQSNDWERNPQLNAIRTNPIGIPIANGL